MERITLFADVLLPLALPGYFTYRIPYEMNDLVKPGQRVVVQFGKTKVYTALVRKIHEKAPDFQNVKYILSVLDIEAVVNEKQFKLWEWISQYYICHTGEVMNAALPPAFKLASETNILINPSYDGDFSNLNEFEMLVVEALVSREYLAISEVSDISGMQKIIPLLKTMVEKSVIITTEEISEVYKPKKLSYIRLSDNCISETALKSVFDSLEKRAFKQLQLLQFFLQLSDYFSEFKNEVKKKDLLENSDFNDALINSLVKKEIFEIFEKNESRLDFVNASKTVAEIEFNSQQHLAYESIVNGFKSKNVVLLHGVTSSGKTEIYIRLIEETIKEGKQVLFLLPEIALTTQIIVRLQTFFGKRVGVYHSKYNENQRVEIWNKVLGNSDNDSETKYSIILGARSALFLPYENLGLIIVDEEHENSFKQYDPAPRYNARDVAIYMATQHNAKVILGSATPAIESYYNSLTGKYHLVEMNERYGGIMMPEILVADLKRETKQKTMRSHFSSLLIEQIENALKNKRQVILFQNRRGFSLRLECDSCHYVPECRNCDVTLIYHKYQNQLRCHYCGYSVKIPDKCPDCGSGGMLMKGYGTEKVEDELQIIFPDAKIQRMDLDSTRTKNAYRRIISEFEEKKINILIGTQMVTKGLDFDNVGIVGVLNADSLINFPDFRSFERSFQLMAQVSGRAGRKGERGKVVIQSSNPEHSVIKQVMENDYLSMFNSQLAERKQFKYPPFYRLIKITLKHRDSDFVNKASLEFAKNLRVVFDKRVLGPEFPLVSKINNMYLKNILLKFERDASLFSVKEDLKNIISKFKEKDKNAQLKILIDVDPI